MVGDGFRVNVLHLELSYGVTVSKGLMGNLFDKLCNHGLTFLNKTKEWVTEIDRHKVNVGGYGE